MASKARDATVRLRLENRRYRRDLKKAEKNTKAFARKAKGSLIAGFKGGFGALAGLATAGGLADIGQDVFKFEEALTRLDIQAKGKADLDAIRESAEKLRRKFGVSAEDVSSAANELVNRLGATAASADKIEVITEAMVASGTSAKDLALLALKLNRAFGLKTADEMREGLSALIEVGKDGSVPLSEMAVVIAQVGSKFAKFGGQGKRAAAELGALIQLAVAGGKAGGFGTAGEAGTGLSTFIEQLENSEQKLRAMGIRVKQVGADGNKELRPLADILELIRKKNLINKRGFVKVFGSGTARNFLAVLLEQTKAIEGQESALESLVGPALKSKATQEDAVKFANSAAGKMKRRWQELRLEIEKVFTPERIELMTEIAGGLGKALGFVIDNWKLFLGAFVAVKALQIGRSLTSWASAARSLAGGLSDVGTSGGRAAKGLRDTRKAGAGPTKKGGKGGAGASVGPELAFTGGFVVGQIIGEKIVEGKKGRFEAGKRRQRETLTRNEQVSQAVQSLTRADVVTAGGQLKPEFEKTLQEALKLGTLLTALQRDALVALQGFEEVEKATSSGGAELIRKIKKSEGIGPKTRQIITAAAGTTPEAAEAALETERAGRAALQERSDALTDRRAARRAAAQQPQAQADAIIAMREAAKALREVADRPVVVKIDSDVVARANEKARDKNRRPAS